MRKFRIERASEIAKEYYLSLTFDCGAKKASPCSSTEGGVDIEEVAATKPAALVRLHVDPFEGFQPYQAPVRLRRAGVDPAEGKQILAIAQKLYDAFVGCDAMLCEINPLIVTPEVEVRALDLGLRSTTTRSTSIHGHRRDARPGGRSGGGARRARRASPT